MNPPPLSPPLSLGLCSWSTRQIEEPALRAAFQPLGINILHLALSPLAELDPSEQTHALAQFRASPLQISAGMISFPGEDYRTLATIRATGGLVPDDLFPQRHALLTACAHLAHQLNLRLVSTHVGFIPAQSDRPNFDRLRDRLASIADQFAALNLTLLFETGQETADTLADFLTVLNRPNVGVNFDPANMILYGKGDPVAAIRTLAPWIQHVHAKDARLVSPPPNDPTAWRAHEAPLGQGDAHLPQVLTALKQIHYPGPLIIEREATSSRTQEILADLTYLRSLIPKNEN